MENSRSNKYKLIFIIAFFLLNILNSALLTTNIILENLSPFPRTIFMVINSFFGDLGFLLIFFGFAIFVFKKDYSRAKFLMYSSIIFGIIYFGLSVFFQHYNMFFSFYNLSAFTSEAGGDAAGFIVDSLLMLLTSAKFIFLLSSLLIIYLFIRLFRRNKGDIKFYTSSLVSGRDRLILGLGFIIMGILLMASGLSAYRIDIEDTWFEDNSPSLYGAQAVGLFNYYVYEGYIYFSKQYDDIKQTKYQSVEERLKDYENSENISPIDNSLYLDHEYMGVFEDKNLLLIQLESFNNFLIGLEIEVNGEYLEVTPNLNKLIGKSIYFDNFYTSVGIGNTSDSEFTVLSGLYPIGNDYIIYDHDKVKYPVLPDLFKEKGYYTFSSHANTGKFYERARVHTTVYGFDKHYAKEDLIVTSDRLIHTWLGDYDFLMQNVENFYELSLKSQVFAHLITITSHMPYSKPSEAKGTNWFYDKDNLFPDGFSVVDSTILNKQIIGYLEHVAYLDYALGKALNRLEELGLFENTIIALYGDHGSDIDAFEMFYQSKHILRNNVNDMINYIYPVEERMLQNRMFNANIPFIIYDPSGDSVIEPKTISLVRGTSSVARTLGNLFGLNPKYYFGVDGLTDVPTFIYNPRNLDIYADGIIISGQSLDYFIYDPAYENYYTDEVIKQIVLETRKYKDFNDKLIKYRVFPDLK